MVVIHQYHFVTAIDAIALLYSVILYVSSVSALVVGLLTIL